MREMEHTLINILYVYVCELIAQILFYEYMYLLLLKYIYNTRLFDMRFLASDFMKLIGRGFQEAYFYTEKKYIDLTKSTVTGCQTNIFFTEKITVTQ